MGLFCNYANKDVGEKLCSENSFLVPVF
jgi:hypothetical protein